MHSKNLYCLLNINDGERKIELKRIFKKVVKYALKTGNPKENRERKVNERRRRKPRREQKSGEELDGAD